MLVLRRTAFAVLSSGLVLGALVAAPAAAAEPSNPLRTLHNDFVAPDVVSLGGNNFKAATAGYSLFDDRTRHFDSYTLRLVSSSEGNVESLRSAFTTIAAQVSTTSGVNITVAPGVLPAPAAGQPDRAPGVRELVVAIDSTSPCSGLWAGCGGPKNYDVDTAPGYVMIGGGQMWIHPDVMSYGTTDKWHVLSHELGHALGLHHFDGTFNGAKQVMHPSSYEAGWQYKAGDRNGLLAQAPFSAELREVGGQYGDIDGDGKADLLGRKADGGLTLFRGNGSLTAPFSGSAKYDVGSGFNAFQRLRIGDIDGDGKGDLLAVTADGVLWNYKGNGDITWPFDGTNRKYQVGTGFASMVSLNLADIDGDGDDDLLAMNRYGKLFVYPSSGSPTSPFSGATSKVLGSGFHEYRAISFGDINNDGLADLVAVSQGGALHVRQNSGSHTDPFGNPPVTTGSGFQTFDRVLLGDLDGDGLADLIGRTAAGTLQAYPGTGISTWPFSGSWSQVGTGFWAFTQLT